MLYCLFCVKRDIENPLRNKQNQNSGTFLCDWLLLPVFRFVVPSRISCGEMRKTCCISVCIRSRQTPSFRQTPGPMQWCCVLCMDQSEGPTQPGIDDSCVTIGLRSHHGRGGLYLSLTLMLQFFLCVQLLIFSLRISKDFSFSRDFLLLRGLAPLMKLGCKINN